MRAIATSILLMNGLMVSIMLVLTVMVMMLSMMRIIDYDEDV